MDVRGAIVVLQTINKSVPGCWRIYHLGYSDGMADSVPEKTGYQPEIITVFICENQRDQREIFCFPQNAQINAEIKALV